MFIRSTLCLIFLALSVATLFTHAIQHAPSLLHISNQSEHLLDCVSDLPSTPVPTPTGTPPANHVMLNEILLHAQKPAYHCTDVSQEVDPWVELYNPLHQSVSLPDAYILIQDTTTSIALPASTTISAQGFLVLFLPQAGITNTSLHIQLFSNGTLIDQVTVPPLAIDTSYARIPDGETWYITTNPTINEANKLPATVQKKPTAQPTHITTKHQRASTKASKQPTSTATNHRQTPVTRRTNPMPLPSPTAVPLLQPQWHHLHLAEPASNRHSAINTPIHAIPPPAPSHPTAEAPQKILLTALLAALLLSIGWSIRLFFLM